MPKKTKSNNNNNKLNPTKKVDWIKLLSSINYPCRYDVFLTVFTLGLYKKFDDFSLSNVEKNHIYSDAYIELINTGDELMPVG